MREERELRKLFKTCFPEETEKYIDYFFQKFYRRENVFYVDAGGKIVSALHIIKKDMRIAGNDFFVPFITGAGTLPEYRGAGHMGGLISDALKTLRKKADFISLGTDDRHGYYGKYGFVTYTFFQEQIVSAGERNFQVEEIEEKTPETAKILADIYQKFSEGKNGFVLRNTEYYLDWLDEIFADDGKLYLLKSGGKYTGYIYDDRGDYKEFVLLDGEQVPKQFEGAAVKIFGDTGAQHNMIRLLNPVSALRKIKYADGVSDSVSIAITDKIIPENNVIIKLKIKNGAGEIAPAENADFTVDIRVLTALVMGLKTDLPERLDKLFAKQKNMVLDRY